MFGQVVGHIVNDGIAYVQMALLRDKDRARRLAITAATRSSATAATNGIT